MNRALEELADGLWQIEADLPSLPIGRRMVIARLGGGDLLVHNAIICDEPTMTALETLGPIRHLVVPSGYHRMDLPAWTVRYPECKVVATAAATPRIRKRSRVDGGLERLPADPRIHYEPLDGVPTEGVLVHRGERGTTLVFNDVLQNHGDLPGIKGKVLKWIGSTGGPKATWIARKFIVSDARAFAAHLRRLATDDVVRIVPGHGALISERAPAVLREIADRVAS